MIFSFPSTLVTGGMKGSCHCTPEGKGDDAPHSCTTCLRQDAGCARAVHEFRGSLDKLMDEKFLGTSKGWRVSVLLPAASQPGPR